MVSNYDFSGHKLKQDKKGRYYLPDVLFYGSLTKETILVASPFPCDKNVYTYVVHTNKDGSKWIKGNNIAKYWFAKMGDVPTRLFLDEEIVKKVGE